VQHQCGHLLANIKLVALLFIQPLYGLNKYVAHTWAHIITWQCITFLQIKHILCPLEINSCHSIYYMPGTESHFPRACLFMKHQGNVKGFMSFLPVSQGCFIVWSIMWIHFWYNYNSRNRKKTAIWKQQTKHAGT